MNYERILGDTDVYVTLLDFEHCFPHLAEKVSSLKEFAKKLSEKALVYVAVKDGERVGISCFYANDFSNYCGYITLIGVKGSHQKKGYGKELLHFTEKAMSALKMKSIKLEVDKDNANAQAFYAKNGFVITEEAEKSFFMTKMIGG